jgi:hypothetical protein
MKFDKLDVEKNNGWGFGFDVARHRDHNTIFVSLNLWKIWISFSIRPNE